MPETAPPGGVQPPGFLTFTLGAGRRRRRVVVTLAVVVVLCFFVGIVYMVAFSQGATARHPWLILVPCVCMAGIAAGIIGLTKMSARLGTSFTVALGPDGIWVGEDFFDYADLAKVQLVVDPCEDTRLLELRFVGKLGPSRRFVLGRRKSQGMPQLVGEYRQFTQALQHALATSGHDVAFEQLGGTS